MSDYRYKCPTEIGYEKFKLTRKQHNKIFTWRKVNMFTKCEYFYNDKSIRIQFFTSVLGKIFALVYSPLAIVIHGVSSIKEIKKEIKGIFNEKGTGKFSSESYWNNGYGQTYAKVMEIVKGE